MERGERDPRILKAIESLPAAPRVVRWKTRYALNTWLARLFVSAFAVAGIGVGLYGVAQVYVLLAGTPIDGIVDTAYTSSSRRGLVYDVHYHFWLGSARIDKRVRLDGRGYLPPRRGDHLAGRAAAAGGYSLAVLDWEGSSDTWVMFFGFGILWNLVVLIIARALWVVPRERRRLVESGTAAIGRVTELKKVGGRGTSYFVYYEFLVARSRERIAGKQQTERREFVWATVGQGIVVFYWPDRPHRNVAYEFSGYEVVGWEWGNDEIRMTNE